MYFVYIIKKYIKNFLLILFSLSFFFVIIDLVANFSRLPDSSNLQVLYIYYSLLYSVDLFYPLALVFSFLFSMYYMIKFNELVSFYSLGFSILKLLKPFFAFSILIFMLFFVLDSSKFAYVREYSQSILDKNGYANTDLFIKFQNKVIYIKKIEPILKEAKDIRVFYLKKKKVYKVIFAKSAFFKNNRWYVKNANVMIIGEKKIIQTKKNLEMLENFKPKIISNLKELNSISFYDAFLAMKIFKDININSLLSIVFYKIFTALSMILLIVIFMFKSPLHQRISNVSLYLIQSVFFTIIIWGLELLIFKFAKQGVISPYLLIFPFIVLLCYSLYLIKKEIV
jgi:lipopolysaccharide export system permease protein